MTTQRVRSHRIDPVIYERTRELAFDARKKWSAQEIHTKLTTELPKANLPSLRTIQRILRELRPSDGSSPWTITESDPDDAKLVLAILDVVYDWWIDEPQMVTVLESDWIVRIRKAAPDLPLNAVWLLTRLYMSHEQRGISPRLLDYFLAFAPWQEGHLSRFISFVRDNRNDADVGELGMLLHEAGINEIPNERGELIPLALGTFPDNV